MNIAKVIDDIVLKYNLTDKQKEEITKKYYNDTRNIITIETELNALADYYNWQNKVTSAIKNAPPLKENQNYYIRTYDEKSNIILQGVNIAKIADTTSGINQVEKVLIDNKYKAYKKVNKVELADNDLEIAICQIGNLLPAQQFHWHELPWQIPSLQKSFLHQPYGRISHNLPYRIFPTRSRAYSV